MRDRTADLLRARQALSQLSYNPITKCSRIFLGQTSDFCLTLFNLEGILPVGCISFTCTLKTEQCNVITIKQGNREDNSGRKPGVIASLSNQARKKRNKIVEQ